MTDLDAIANEEASKRKPGVACWVCSIPERAWVDAQKGRRTVPVIVATLIRQGHPESMATRHRIQNHWTNHVR